MNSDKDIFLFRHGDVEDRFKKRFRGALDVGLSPLGQKMSEVNADFLAKLPIDLVITSGLQRTDFVGKLVKAKGVAHLVERRFREAQFGDWEGKNWEEVIALYPEESKRYKEDFLNMQFPGGESVATLRSRLDEAWCEVVKRPEKRIAIIGHSTGNGCLMANLKGTTFAKAGMQLLGSYHHIRITGSKAQVLSENIVLFDELGLPLQK